MRLLFVSGIAFAITAINALKPITADDAAYVQFARHIAEHPLDPYGFPFDGLQPANTVLAPPVFLYWFGLGVRLFGESVFLWKLWLLPICWLLVYCLHQLATRFAPGVEKPFVLMVSLSPTVLPCINLMLDIPALALSLAALLLFFHACDRNSLRLSLAAGIVAGVAMQTKYTAFLIPPLFATYALLSSRKRLAVIACAAPFVLFVAWEMLIAWKYGDSHFLLGRAQFREPFVRKLNFALPLLGYLGATASAGIVLAAAAWNGRKLAFIAIALILAHVGFLIVPPTGHVLWAKSMGRPVITLNHVVYGTAGIALLALGALVILRLMRSSGEARIRIELLLVSWLFMEFAGYFVLSPYPATRRIIGLVLVGTLLAFRLGCQTWEQKTWCWRAVVLNGCFGAYFFLIDFNYYHGPTVLAEAIAAVTKSELPHARMWHVSNSAFSFYGERTGMTRLNPGEINLQAGDIVCVPEGHEATFDSRIAGRPIEHLTTWSWTPYLPLRSRYQYGNVALERIDGPLFRVNVYRVGGYSAVASP